MGYTLLVSPEGTPPPPLAQVSPVIGSGAAPAGSVGAGFAAEPVRTSDHVVKYGETLSELAQQYRPNDVSLDQMLVALYQANPQAFMGENMNRLKSGAVLKLPGAEATRAVPPVPARELIEAHSADFGAYRSRLASQVRDAAASETAASRQARGQVQARVQDRKDGAALTPDQLKLSQGGVKAASSPEAAVSREAAAREAAQREAELARNVQALKQLQQMAGASSVAAGGQPADAASVPGAGPTVAVQVPAAASTVAAASAAASAVNAQRRILTSCVRTVFWSFLSSV
jgi:pilus assembly protein FimV